MALPLKHFNNPYFGLVLINVLALLALVALNAVIICKIVFRSHKEVCPLVSLLVNFTIHLSFLTHFSSFSIFIYDRFCFIYFLLYFIFSSPLPEQCLHLGIPTSFIVRLFSAKIDYLLLLKLFCSDEFCASPFRVHRLNFSQCFHWLLVQLFEYGTRPSALVGWNAEKGLMGARLTSVLCVVEQKQLFELVTEQMCQLFRTSKATQTLPNADRWMLGMFRILFNDFGNSPLFMLPGLYQPLVFNIDSRKK